MKDIYIAQEKETVNLSTLQAALANMYCAVNNRIREMKIEKEGMDDFQVSLPLVMHEYIGNHASMSVFLSTPLKIKNRNEKTL